MIASSLLIGCSGSETAKQSPQPNVKSPAPKSAPQAPQPSPKATTAAKPASQPKPAAPKPAAPKPVSAPAKVKLSPAPKVELSKSEKQLVSKVQKEVQKKGSVAKQDTGHTYLGNVLRSQQAEKLVTGRFTTNLQKLESDSPKDSGEFQLQVLEANENKAIVAAIAKQNGIFSYTGAVYAQDASIPVSAICKSNEPTQTPPGTPRLTGSTIVCAQGSTVVE
ncbi:type IV pilin-like G/H family protein [Acaryochloris sp. CCMEE 5410]|uniref:type IV pilin-like G/H family protein n=1 Tax=Acaryochloris sp. CCMEE 5410 TaxID=310037 RepID=UPI0002484C8B|nr:type IV pilin-like G/H family protein [Acaryochloris sp. CCMEE 5410]